MQEEELGLCGLKQNVNETQEIRIAIAKALQQLVLNWRSKAGRYLFEARCERDLLGRKFYESSVIAYGNCATELEKALNDLILPECQLPTESSVKQELASGHQIQPLAPSQG